MSQNRIKEYEWLVLAAAAFLSAGSCGKAEKPELETEEVAEQLLEETEMDTAHPEDTEEESQIIDESAEIDLNYIPEMGYDDNIQLGGPYKIEDNRYNTEAMQKKNYACWKDWLIIGPEVYKKQEDGRYKRFGKSYLSKMFEYSYLDSRSVIRQYENYLILLKQMDNGQDELSEWCFCIYDMDTEKMVEMDDFLEEGGIFTFYTLYGAPNFYVFEGKIYYCPRDCKSIRTIDLSNGKNEEFYSMDNTAYQRIQNFAIRGDGAVIAVLQGEQVIPDSLSADERDALGDNLPRHIEYWCIEHGDDGVKETKIGETDDYAGADIQEAQNGLLMDCVGQRTVITILTAQCIQKRRKSPSHICIITMHF